MMKALIKIILTTLIFIFLASSGMSAQQLVYEPRNPAFGGSPINYQWMLSSANLQNRFEITRQTGIQRDPLQDFQNSLQRQILSQLTRDIILRRFGDGEPLQESRYEFGEFAIDIIPGLDGITITISNILTGDQTSITIPNF